MKGKPKIQRVSSEILGQVIERRTPCDLFLTKEGHNENCQVHLNKLSAQIFKLFLE